MFCMALFVYTISSMKFSCLILGYFFALFILNPCHAQHLAILQLADEMLEDPTKWHQEDERICLDDEKNQRWSLYCALYQAAIQIEGRYKHRGVVMRTVRKVIKQATPKQRFKHPIRDYNNLKSTTFKDLKLLLQQAIERLS